MLKPTKLSPSKVYSNVGMLTIQHEADVLGSVNSPTVKGC